MRLRIIRLTLGALATFALLFPFHLAKSFAVKTEANQSPTLTFDAGGEFKAEISNYSLDATQFCFTLTNLSSRPLIGFAFTYGRPIEILNFTQADPVSFRMVPFDNFNGAVFIPAFEGRLAAHESASFCMFADYAGQGISISEVLKMVVLFSNTSPSLGHSNGQIIKDFCPNTVITELTADKLCFQIFNDSLSEVITGVGFDLPDDCGPFTLISVDPTPQPDNQNLVFTTSPGAIPNIRQKLDFAVLAGEKFAGGKARGGVPSGSSSSIFCVAGNFAGLTLSEIPRAAARIQRGLTLFDCDSPATGLIGILSGNPR